MKKNLIIICLTAGSFMSFTTTTNIPQQNITTNAQNDVVIEGVGVTKTIDTTGKESIRIEGTKNKITINGDCQNIKIEGVDNIVTVNDVKSVTIEGTGNKVSYKTTSNSEGKLKTSISGVNNKIIKIE